MQEAVPENPLEAVLLDGASSGSGSAQDSSGASRRNAAARKALRQALTENPRLISRTIAGHMAEDLLGILQPKFPPLTSARSWVEHRSRIGPQHPREDSLGGSRSVGCDQDGKVRGDRSAI